ncbi:MAG: hypothetical protein CMI63_16060 [Parvularcula sp.]|nr:hypothetical protein [Parvularcula sp.]
MKEVINLPVFKAQSASVSPAISAPDFSQALTVHSTPLHFAGPRPERRKRPRPSVVESAVARRYRRFQKLARQNGPQALDVYL